MTTPHPMTPIHVPTPDSGVGTFVGAVRSQCRTYLALYLTKAEKKRQKFRVRGSMIINCNNIEILEKINKDSS